MDTMTIAIAGVAALAILLIAVGIAMSGGGSGVNARLERYASGKPEKTAETASGGGSLGTALSSPAPPLAQLNKVVEQRDFGANLAREIARADLKLKVSEYLMIWAGATIGVPILMLVLSAVMPGLRNPIVLLIGGLIGFMLPRFWLGRRKSGRLSAFNKQLPDTITLIANALRAGSSFLQAIELVVRESAPPISTEFGRVIREVNLGLSFDVALENMVRRVRSEDLELMATAISIQHTVGGNLAEILDSIAYTIRERVRIKGEIRTLTAQQRLSGYVVGFLPIGLAGFLFIAAPGFMSPMFDDRVSLLGLPAGVIILLIGGFAMFIGLHVHPQDRRHRGLGHGPPVPGHRGGHRRRHPPHLRRARGQVVRGPGPGPPHPAGHDAGREPGGARAPAAVLRADGPPAGGPALRLRVRASPAPPSPRRPRSAWRWPGTPATCGPPTGWASRPWARSSAPASSSCCSSWSGCWACR